ncbi:MAG: hypothetical protein Kow0031_20240 [Anaerolineae bacterium]
MPNHRHESGTGNISVIIAVKNGERFLAEALRSIAQQTLPPRQILVIDGHSTDDTARIAQSFSGVEFHEQTGSGIPNAYNCGVKLARGDLIAFLSHDDIWTPDKLAAQAGYLRDHPAAMYCVARAKFFLEPGCSLPPSFKPALLQGDHVARIMETLVARRELFDIVGGFNEALGVAEDVDWYARVADAGYPVNVLDKVLLHKRVHHINSSLTAETHNRNLLTALRESAARKRDSVRLNDSADSEGACR